MSLVSPAACDSSVVSSACRSSIRSCKEALSAASDVRRRTSPLSSGVRSETEFISRRARYWLRCERLSAMLLSSAAWS